MRQWTWKVKNTPVVSQWDMAGTGLNPGLCLWNKSLGSKDGINPIYVKLHFRIMAP